MDNTKPIIALIGARGIPARSGGCETIVEEVSQKLDHMGFDVVVTCNSQGFYTDKYYNITRVHSPSLQGKTLTIPTVNELVHTFRVLFKFPQVRLIYYVLPYGSLIAIFPKLLGKKIVICTDGIEWSKPLARMPYFSPLWKIIATIGSWHLKLTELLTVKVAHIAIADSRAIASHLIQRYNAKNVVYISHGARTLLDHEVIPEEEQKVLNSYSLISENYYFTVARIVAENNIHIEIEGIRKSKTKKKLVIVGNFNIKDGYNKYLIDLKSDDPQIIFIDPIWDKYTLGILRKNCYGYIHAYQAGGTNPSLLEQMLFSRPIMATDIAFHTEVLQEGGIYFKDAFELADKIEMLETGKIDIKGITKCFTRRIKEEYNWDLVAESYYSLFEKLISNVEDVRELEIITQ